MASVILCLCSFYFLRIFYLLFLWTLLAICFHVRCSWIISGVSIFLCFRLLISFSKILNRILINLKFKKNEWFFFSMQHLLLHYLTIALTPMSLSPHLLSLTPHSPTYIYFSLPICFPLLLVFEFCVCVVLVPSFFYKLKIDKELETYGKLFSPIIQASFNINGLYVFFSWNFVSLFIIK